MGALWFSFGVLGVSAVLLFGTSALQYVYLIPFSSDYT
jgi:hypothetical protein